MWKAEKVNHRITHREDSNHMLYTCSKWMMHLFPHPGWEYTLCKDFLHRYTGVIPESLRVVFMGFFWKVCVSFPLKSNGVGTVGVSSKGSLRGINYVKTFCCGKCILERIVWATQILPFWRYYQWSTVSSSNKNWSFHVYLLIFV